MNGPELAREGREAVEVIAGLVVAAGSSWVVVAPAAAVLVVSVGGAVFLVVLATSLELGGVALAVMVVDALTQDLLVEPEMEVVLVDLSVVDMGSCRVVARLSATCRRARALAISGVS